MKYVIYGMNLFNYIILITWISLSLKRISEVGLDIVSFFALFSIFLLIISLIFSFISRTQDDIKDTLNMSIFINLFNLVILTSILLAILF
ncbi:hypothetical protein [Staphylococcus capitis]|uniref:hypothetical protein n=1 Tax=Staphylococcus capitis TaxID=29388 RepID=UPI00066A4142|nr:hypothetical protein [Staphylococcus capitis]